jgi:hypothetical protein
VEAAGIKRRWRTPNIKMKWRHEEECSSINRRVEAAVRDGSIINGRQRHMKREWRRPST